MWEPLKAGDEVLEKVRKGVQGVLSHIKAIPKEDVDIKLYPLVDEGKKVLRVDVYGPNKNSNGERMYSFSAVVNEEGAVDSFRVRHVK